MSIDGTWYSAPAGKVLGMYPSKGTGSWPITLADGESYAVTARYDSDPVVHYDYRAWFSLQNPNTVAWTDGQSAVPPAQNGTNNIVSGKAAGTVNYFIADPQQLLMKRFDGDGSSNPAAGKVAYIHIPRLDADVDSDNNSATQSTLAEDILESDPSYGALVFSSTGDVDGDGIIDSEDFDGIDGAAFAPLKLSLSTNILQAQTSSGSPTITLTLDYDPTKVRVWTKLATDSRTIADIVPNGTGLNASTVGSGLAPGTDLTLHVEALTDDPTPIPITVRAHVSANLWSGELVDQVHVAPLKVGVKSIAFHATSATLRYDVFTDSGELYSSKQWTDDNADGTPDWSHPVAFKRGSTMLLDTAMQFAMPAGQTLAGLGQNLKVKGIGPDNIEFHSTNGVNDPNTPHDVPMAYANGVLSFTAPATTAFQNKVKYYETLDIEWSYSLDGGANWMNVGTTKNQTYVLYDAIQVDLRHSIVHFSTKKADGKDVVQDVIDAVWSEFTDLDVRTVDNLAIPERNVAAVPGKQLTYYADWTVAPGTVPDLLQNGDGQCGPWVLLFLYALKSHGIQTANNLVTVRPNPATGANMFLVGQWNFGQAQTTEAPQHLNVASTSNVGGVLHSNYIQAPGPFWWLHEEMSPVANSAPGQGNPNPLPMFNLHYMAKINGTYYDVAYGKTYASLAAWETASIGGYVFSWTDSSLTEQALGVDLDGDNNIDAVQLLDLALYRGWANPAGNQMIEAFQSV